MSFAEVLGAVERLGPVKKVGKEYRGPCPVHGDKHPSLDVHETEDGSVMVKCRSKGCSFKAIAAALGLPESAFFPPKGERPASRASRYTEFSYMDEGGVEHSQAVRVDPPNGDKKFYQRHRGPDGEWINDAKGVRRLVFGLPELIAADPSEPVFLVAGEKCVGIMRDHGFVATTNIGGEGHWTAEDSEFLRGRDVVVFPDADEVGHKHGQQVAAALQGIASSVKVLDVLGLPLKGDCEQYFSAGHTAEELRELAANTKEWTPQTQASAADNWPPLQPLVADLAPEPYPINAHPSLSREAIEEVQGFVQAPVALVAQSALGAMSVTMQALCDVQRPSMSPSPTSLFMVAAALSGERKTSCDGYFRAPIDDFEHAATEAAKPALADYAGNLATWEACKRAIAARIEKAKKNREPIDADAKEMREHQASLPRPPRVPVLLIQDSTSEALISQLSAWPSASIAASEGGMVFGAHAMSAETIMRTLALYNSAWDGKPLRVLRRKENGSVFLSSARLTLNVQVQPGVMRDFLSGDRGLSRDVGFLARVLWSCPETTQGQRMFKHAPKHWPALARFNARTAELLNQRPRIDADGALTLDALPLSPAAEVAWIVYHDAVERRLRIGGDLCDIRDVASKAADNAARAAAIFDVYASRKTAITAKTAVAEPIDGESMAAAIRVVEWHLLEARRFLGSLSLPTEYVDASLLEEWLRSYCKNNSCKSVSLSTIQKYGPGRLRSKDVLAGVLKTLSDLGRAREIPGEGKARLVEVAPSLLATAVIAVSAVIQPTAAPGMDDAFEPAEDTHCGDDEGEIS